MVSELAPHLTRGESRRWWFRRVLSWLPAVAVLCLLVGGVGAQTPAAPTIDRVAAGDTALTVVWSPPAGVSGVVAYDVRHILTSATDKSDANWTVVDDAWTEGSLYAILTGLVNGSPYDVQVRAVTSGVDGAWSTTTTGTPVEPGGVLSEAVAMVAGVPVRGVVGPDSDVDFFRFEVSGLPRTREFYVYTTGNTDTYGELFNQNGGRVGRSDDAHVASGRLNFMLTTNGRLSGGTYYVSVGGGRDDAKGPYTLHLGVVAETTGLADATPIEVGEVATGVFGGASDVDYFELVLSEDTVVAVRAGGPVPDTVGAILDSKGAEIVANDVAYLWPYTQQFAMRARLAAGTYYIRIRPSGDLTGTLGAGLYNLYVDAAPEPGGTLETAGRLGLGETGGGSIDPAGDVDWFRIDLDAAARVWISASSYSTRGRFVDIEMELADHTGAPLSRHIYDRAVSGAGHYSFFGGRLEAGTYYLRVSAEKATATGPYLVALRPDPSFDRSLIVCPKPPVDTPAGVEDPLFGCQWHLINDGSGGGVAGEDINLGDVWSTTMGAGITVAVVDLNPDWRHADLVDNVLPLRNHWPASTRSTVEPHATEVAGIIAARDNDIGVRGVAPRANIYFNNSVAAPTPANRADALARGRATTSVSNNSWNWSSKGEVGRSSQLQDAAIESGLREGDGGKGVVYVFTSGNSHSSGGWASLDELISHHGVTVVCAVDNSGVRAPYSEQGPNLWVCAPSGPLSPPGITTTSTEGYLYRDTFWGTSAAAPIVSGVVALVRSANRTLTWRDVKLILAETARKNHPSDSGWQQAGRRVGSGTYEHNHKYGFGVVNAEAAVQLAASWTNLPPMLTATVSSSAGAVSIPDNRSSVSQSVDVDTQIDFVEYVEVDASFEAPAFRHLNVELVSPSGAVSLLSRPTEAHNCRSGCALTAPFRFGSARHLGEDPSGTWTLRMRDLRSGGSVSRLVGWTLTVYGHRSGPAAPASGGVTPGDGSLTVSWTAPTDTGASEVTGYDVRHIRSDATDKSDANWTLVEDVGAAAARSYTISSLANGVRRDVQVRAKNSSRAGKWSVTAAGTPGASNSVPSFTDGDSATRTVDENTSANVNIGSAVGAVDPDTSDTLVYTLGGTDAASFGIVASTGQLQTKAALDYESPGDADGDNVYEVTVSVSDGLDDAGTADNAADDTVAVTIEVADVDEPPVVTGPTGPSHPENSAGLVATYSAVDPEGSAVTWDLSGDDAAHFYWIVTNGRYSLFVLPAFVLPSVVRSLPDVESPADADSDNVYEVTVEASDGSTTGTLQVEVTITDVNEAPALTGPETVEADEGTATTTTVATYTAADPENESISWSLSGDDSDDFSISAGKLSFSAVPDFEAPADADRNNVYKVTIEASDGSFSVSQQVTVTVRKVDEAVSVTLPISDIAEMAVDDTQEVSLSGVFNDADGDSLTITAASSNESVTTVSVAADFSSLTLTGVGEGTATITVTAQDTDGNNASDTFDVPVIRVVELPGPVLALQLSATTNSVKVQWAAPESGDAPDRYIAHLNREGGGEGETRRPGPNKTFVVFRGLNSGSAYKVWVRAQNEAGKGERTSASITLPMELPGTVTSLELTATADSVTVSWSPPQNASAVDGYIVHLRPEGGATGSGNTKTPKAKKTQVTFKNLEAGQTYRVWVRAQNEAGKDDRAHATITLPTAQPEQIDTQQPLNGAPGQ